MCNCERKKNVEVHRASSSPSRHLIWFECIGLLKLFQTPTNLINLHFSFWTLKYLSEREFLLLFLFLDPSHHSNVINESLCNIDFCIKVLCWWWLVNKSALNEGRTRKPECERNVDKLGVKWKIANTWFTIMFRYFVVHKESTITFYCHLSSQSSFTWILFTFKKMTHFFVIVDVIKSKYVDSLKEN